MMLSKRKPAEILRVEIVWRPAPEVVLRQIFAFALLASGLALILVGFFAAEAVYIPLPDGWLATYPISIMGAGLCTMSYRLMVRARRS